MALCLFLWEDRIDNWRWVLYLPFAPSDSSDRFLLPTGWAKRSLDRSHGSILSLCDYDLTSRFQNFCLDLLMDPEKLPACLGLSLSVDPPHPPLLPHPPFLPSSPPPISPPLPSPSLKCSRLGNSFTKSLQFDIAINY